MDTIAIDPLGDRKSPLFHRADLSPSAWRDGMWCTTTLSPDIHVRVGWDGLINRAYDNDDPRPSGHWIAES